MLFIVNAMDKTGALALRQANRTAHLDYVAATGKVRLGGPHLDAAGNMIGSMIILDADDLAAAQAWARNDPYNRAGLFASCEVTPWRVTVNACGAEL